MRLAMTAVFLISIILLLAGCSQDGDLKIVNSCSTTFNGTLNDDFITIEPGDSYTQNIYIGKKLLIVGPNSYDVVLSGSAWTKKQFTTPITVNSNGTTTYTIKSDIGAIKLLNDYIKDIVAMRIKKCSDSEYGDLIVRDTHPIKPGKFFLMQKEEGCWDIYLQYGRTEIPDTIRNIETVVDSVTPVHWNPVATD